MSQIITDNPQGNLIDIANAKMAAEALHAAYPGHLWGVACDVRTGFMDIRNLGLSGNWGFRIRLSKIYTHSALKRDVLRAGGELLERYNLSRGRLDQDALATLHTDFAGRLKADM